jgi:hypothetical protein
MQNQPDKRTDSPKNKNHTGRKKMEATGRTNNPQRLRSVFFSLLILQPILLPEIILAADLATGSCPLTTHRYVARLASPHLTAVVGETVALHFSLDPPKPPQGFFVSVNMSALHEPDAAEGRKPDILTGFPETSILFKAPGEYRYDVTVSLIAKSSCGGVKADTIFRGEALIDVKPKI